MQRIIVILFLFFAAIPLLAFTREELLQQLSDFETRAGAIEKYIRDGENGTPLPKSRAALLADLTAIEGEAQRIKKDIDKLSIPVVPPTCSYTYTDWIPATCPASKTQTRTETHAPPGCAGTSAPLTQSCTYVPPVCTYTYTEGACQSNSRQTLTVKSKSPEGCADGTPLTTQACTYVPPDASQRGVDPLLIVPVIGGVTVGGGSDTDDTDDDDTDDSDDDDDDSDANDADDDDSNDNADGDDADDADDGGTGGGTGGGRNDASGDATALTFGGFLDRISGIINSLIPFIIGLAVFFVIWKIFTYITHAADEEKRSEAKRFIIYGVIGIFIMLSIWGFVNIIANTLDIGRDIGEGDIPTFETLLHFK